MFNQNNAFSILLENAKTLKERNEVFTAVKENTKLGNTMVSNLYKSALDKANIDFDTIPDSKGDVTKYTGYKFMVETLKNIKDIASASNSTIEEIAIVEETLINLVSYRDLFERGFKLDKEFVILQYNLLVLSCMDATSVILSSYVDFVKRPDNIEFKIIKVKHHSECISIKNLSLYNKSVKNGDFAKVLNAIIKTGNEGIIGIDDALIPVLIVGALLTIVPITRELTFFFFYSRMRISDYLKQQSEFLAMNKQMVEANGQIPAKKRSEIIKKQAKVINSLNDYAEKIQVNHKTVEPKAKNDLKDENKSWTLSNVQTQTASNDANGFSLL